MRGSSCHPGSCWGGRRRPSPVRGFRPSTPGAPTSRRTLPISSRGSGEVAVFHRGDSILVAAATRMPEPSDSSAAQSFPSEVPSDEPDGPFAWAQPGLLDEPDQVGLFLIDSERRFREARHRGDSESVLALSVPAGRYLLSLEAWVPTTGRGGRLRHGIVTDTIPRGSGHPLRPDHSLLRPIHCRSSSTWPCRSCDRHSSCPRGKR